MIDSELDDERDKAMMNLLDCQQLIGITFCMMVRVDSVPFGSMISCNFLCNFPRFFLTSYVYIAFIMKEFSLDK